MPKTVLVFFVTLVVCLGCSNSNSVDQSAITFAHDRGREKFSQRNQIEVRARMGDIRAELATLNDHPWAGIYSKMLPLGARWELFIAPTSGFAYICQSTDVFVNGAPRLIDHNYGSVTWENGIIKLSPVLENDKEERNHLPTEFVLIRWGSQICLVPADGIIDFCNVVNSGFGIYFIRDARGLIPHPAGKPEVPEKYKPYLLEKPVDGEIIAVGETREIQERSRIATRETVVTINRGSRDGLLPGMQFFVVLPTRSSFPITLTKVTETESEGIVQGTPQVGWSVSTRFRR